MPHTYMRTVGPTSNGTTSRCAVSKRWIVIARCSCGAGSDAFDAERSLALVLEVDGEQRGRERLEPDGVLERAGVEGAQVGDGVDEVEDGRAPFVVADDEDVAGERLADVGQGGGGDEVERGDDQGVGRLGLHLGGDGTRRRRD